MKSSYTLAEKREFAADMRRRPTLAESAFWPHLERRKLGYRFQRQAVVRGYIVDFYCVSAKLAIEVDGSVHDLEEQAAADEEKERILENYGIGLLRFSNEDVLNHVAVVLARIRSECEVRIGLKALSPSSTQYGKRREASSSSREAKNVQLLVNHSAHSLQGRYPQRKSSAPSVNCLEISQAEAESINRKFAVLCRQRSLDFIVYDDTRTMAERAWEQKFRLQEYLAKKRRPQDEAERRKLLSEKIG